MSYPIPKSSTSLVSRLAASVLGSFLAASASFVAATPPKGKVVDIHFQSPTDAEDKRLVTAVIEDMRTSITDCHEATSAAGLCTDQAVAFDSIPDELQRLIEESDILQADPVQDSRFYVARQSVGPEIARASGPLSSLRNACQSHLGLSHAEAEAAAAMALAGHAWQLAEAGTDWPSVSAAFAALLRPDERRSDSVDLYSCSFIDARKERPVTEQAVVSLAP